MPRITQVRAVLLSAPYATPTGNLEVLLHLSSGMRTTGLVEVTLDNGVKGLGESYLAVFAPHVFRSIVELLAPQIVGREIGSVEAHSELMRTLETATGYWSLQGAARHVLSGIEIAMQDCRAQLLGVPLWKALGGVSRRALPVYASGGDSLDASFMARELEKVASLGIKTFKIRARKGQAAKVAWCQREGAKAGIAIAVDMTQNLAIPSQSVADVLQFLKEIHEAGHGELAFLEEALGPLDVQQFAELRRCTTVPVAGGEIVTTPWELVERVRAGLYGIVQPDATVIGGIGAVMEVFAAAREHHSKVYVHCWGSGVGMLANYHAALAGGGEMVEWPIPAYPLREALFAAPIEVVEGHLSLPDAAGLGARLTPEIEACYPFREEALYNCHVDPADVPVNDWNVFLASS